MAGNRFYAGVFFSLILFLDTSYGASSNILKNPGFESAFGSNDWTSRSCTLSRVTSPTPHGGTYCGAATSRTATWNGIQQSLLGKMVIGQTYTISGYVRTSSSSSSSVDLSIQKTENGTVTYTQVASGTASSSGWTLLSGTYTLTVTGVLTDLDVYVEGPASGVSIYFDDANVYGLADGNATGNVNTNVHHQILDGFGAAGAWSDSTLVTLGSSQPAIYDVLFGNLGLDIYRIRNDYNESDTSSYMSDTSTIVSKANTSLGHSIRVLLSCWSPQASLKSNSSTVGGTLAKDGSGNYRYADFAQWWADSLTAWSNKGVNATYISMQNEPDFTAGWDTCFFAPTQTDANAGYEQALAALYTKLNTLPSHPKILAPETANFTDTPSYMSALTATDISNIYGYAHHPYDASTSAPDGEVSAMANLASLAGSKPIMMTEFSGSTPFTWTDAMNLAVFINDFMTVEGASAYVYWELFWNGSGDGSLVSITSSSYTINSVYYAMKHYSYFTDPNWIRIDANTTSTGLRISAFLDPNNLRMSSIIINPTPNDINLALSFSGFTVADSNIWRSSSSQNCVLLGKYTPGTLYLYPANSITTLQLFASVSAPGKATSPSPSNSATGVGITTDISWTAGSGATSHDVYFGTTSPGTLRGNQAGTTYDTGTMANNTTYYWRIDEKNAGGTTTGDVWSFTTIVAAPGKATSPSPASGATGVSITTGLSWTAGSNATSHDVYFGTAGSPPLVSSSQAGTTYNPGTLLNNTVYNWRIDEKNAGGTTTGDVWSFTTIVAAPGKATSPSPASGATGVSITTGLSWTAGSNATSHDVYFGTAGSPPLVSSSQAGTTYNPGTLLNNTVYNWRIDEKNAGGTTTGDVWSFTTIVAAPGKATSPSPSNGATGISTSTTLSWSAGSGATSHDVYFGTASSPPLVSSSQSGTNYGPGTLLNNTTYNWRIDEKNAGGTTTGDVWSFTTIVAAPGKATSPSPTSGATGVSISTTLSWSAGSGATSHDVYFGTASSPPLVSSSQSGTNYGPGTLLNNTTYNWRIDEKNAGGTTTGDVWSFTTIVAPPATPTGLTATAGIGTVSLDWNDNNESDLAGYNVYRSITSDSNYVKQNGSLLSSSDYSDTNVVNGTSYYYVVTAVNTSSLESNYSSEASAMPSNPAVTGTGAILREWWSDIPGTEVNDLTSDVNYPDNSTGRELLTKLEGPNDWADNYGTRIRGYVIPPADGNYTFWIAGSDSGELWLSTDSNSSNAALIAYIPGSSQSSPIALVANQMYYIDVLHKAGIGSDNIAVAWQGPGISQQVIDGLYLSPCCLDFRDFANLAEDWNLSDCNSGNDWCSGFDFNRDGSVLLDDLRTFADWWLTGLE